MTISTTYAPVQYNGNGVTTVFAFPYVFFNNTDLVVTLTNTDTGVDSPATGYTVSGGGGEDGDVTFSVAPASNQRITIELSLPYTQGDDYVEDSAFPAQTLESGFDRCALRDQQLANAVDRSLKFAATLTGSLVGILPQPEDGKLLVWDGVTGTIGNADVADISTSIDVVLTSLASGDYLVWDGTNWANEHKDSLPADGVQATGSAGLSLKNNGGTAVLTVGAGGGTGATFAGGVNTTGEITINGTSASAGYLMLGEDSDNGTNKVTLIAPASIASNYTVNMPPAAGTILTQEALPSVIGISKYTTLADQVITAAGALTIAHGLGATPIRFDCFLVCQTAELGYSIGDVVAINPHQQGATSNGQAITFDATNVYLRFGATAGAYEVLHKTTGVRTATTAANWRLRVRVWA